MAGSLRGARHGLSAARPALAAVVAGLLSVSIAAAAVQDDPHQPSFRLFLTQGGDLVLRGDYVRVGDRVVFLLPLHEDEAVRASQLVTVPAAAVDWDTTAQYAAAVRAARYAAAGGPADFGRMSGEVAQALNAIAFTDDPQTRKALAQRTRQRLLDWTEANHGYRAQEVVEIVALLDEAVAADTGAAGDLSVSLIATTASPHPLPVLPDPSLQEIIARALTAARLTPVPEERSAILHAALATLDDPHSAVGSEWRAVTRMIAARDLEAHLADARALRRERDRRLQRTAAAHRYHAGVKAVMDRFTASRAALDDMRLAAGPTFAVLASLERRLQDAADDLAGHAPPVEIRSSHDLLRQAFRLAAGAARQRLRAVQNADPRAAWDSAAAAAGALMLYDRAAVKLDRSLPQTEPN